MSLITEDEWKQREREARRKIRRERVLDAVLIGILVVIGLALIIAGGYYFFR